MAKRSNDKNLAQELLDLVAETFPGMEVEVGIHPRWGRRCLTFRWAGFEGLLPEERFHRLVQVIPEEFRAHQLSGCIWLELTPKESLEQYLKYPRSEDVAERESALYEKLVRGSFFSTLAMKLGPTPESTCSGAFTMAGSVLEEKGMGGEVGRDVKLALIRNGAYCDCQVLNTAQPALARLYVGAA